MTKTISDIEAKKNNNFFANVKFLSQILFAKKNTYIIPIVFFLLNLIAAISFAFIKIEGRFLPIITYAIAFIELMLTVVYSSLKHLNLYHDLEKEGVEIILFSKPISRKKIILSKIFVSLIVGGFWTLVLAISNMFLLIKLDLLPWYLMFIYTFLAMFSVYVIFGNIVSMISIKLNKDMSVALALLMFAPIAIGGTFIQSNSTSTMNNVAHYLNKEYKYHHSKTEADFEKFFLNKKKNDSLYLIPNGQGKKIENWQKEYLEKAFNASKNSALEWQTYSWIAFPYQMLDIFNTKSENIFELASNERKTNMDKYLYYKNNDELSYSYKLTNKSNDLIYKNVNGQYQYIFPNILKLNSHFNNQDNTGLIYIRKNIDSIDARFPEDELELARPETFEGELKWKYIFELLNHQEFNKFAENFFGNFEKKFVGRIETHASLVAAKIDIVNSLQFALNNKENILNKIIDPSTTIFDQYAIVNRIIKSDIERKIYLTTALIYYAYFKYQNSFILNALLINDNEAKKYTPSSYNISIDGKDFIIGGVKSVTPRQVAIKKTPQDPEKIVTRYTIEYDTEDNITTGLFATTDEVMTIERNKKVNNKNLYILIWISIATLFAFLNGFIYYRKDYK
ncbi:hypothetical protein [Metamycoplasma equirhinis]|uniref:hypothetical protein n=1 Tax=Metamycoplasma equirhinis TaxID=92402 RepID=UPI003593D05E